MTRVSDSGVSLLNVLVVVSIGAGLVQIMLSDQEHAIDHLAADRDVAQAQNPALSGVTSARVALRRDLIDAPHQDHAGEVWATAMQDVIALDEGSFEVLITDARGRFDLNALGATSLIEQRVFANLLSVLDLPQVLGPAIAQIVGRNGPLSAPVDLIKFGIAPEDVARLQPHVAAFASQGTVNLNSATEPVLSALLSNPNAARSLVARRSVKGYLDQSDLAALGVILPPLGGFTSDTFDVTSEARINTARRVIHRRLVRDSDTKSVRAFPLQ